MKSVSHLPAAAALAIVSEPSTAEVNGYDACTQAVRKHVAEGRLAVR